VKLSFALALLFVLGMNFPKPLFTGCDLLKREETSGRRSDGNLTFSGQIFAFPTMMMLKTLLSAAAIASASAFVPAAPSPSSTALQVEKSRALPFMNRPPLVSEKA